MPALEARCRTPAGSKAVRRWRYRNTIGSIAVALRFPPCTAPARSFGVWRGGSPDGGSFMKAAKSSKATKAPRAAQVDVNTATVEELKSIRGLGKTRALEIARYRDKHGPFKSLDEITKVPHMGDMPWGE